MLNLVSPCGPLPQSLLTPSPSPSPIRDPVQLVQSQNSALKQYINQYSFSDSFTNSMSKISGPSQSVLDTKEKAKVSKDLSLNSTNKNSMSRNTSDVQHYGGTIISANFFPNGIQQNPISPLNQTKSFNSQKTIYQSSYPNSIPNNYPVISVNNSPNKITDLHTKKHDSTMSQQDITSRLPSNGSMSYINPCSTLTPSLIPSKSYKSQPYKQYEKIIGDDEMTKREKLYFRRTATSRRNNQKINDGDLPKKKKLKKRHSTHPPEETATYQSFDVTQFSSSQGFQRPPRRRAVIVGINYILAPDILLRGCCNDASALALALINLCDFSPADIILLIDSFPSFSYRSREASTYEEQQPGDFVLWKDRQPTRRNILLALNWLRANTLPGDVLFFFFAGHGIQIDDMSGWEGEGYDEAILPMDFYGEEVNAITAVMIRNLLLSVENDVQVTIVLDCNGGQTALDPSGTGGWSFIKGVKQRGVWPFITDATDKVARATYDIAPWTDSSMKRRGARPRFVPGVEISSAQELLDPTLQKPSAQIGTRVRGYLFSAAPWGQSAIEASMPILQIPAINEQCEVIHTSIDSTTNQMITFHGVFSWCFISAITDSIINLSKTTKLKSVSYGQLLDLISYKIKSCKTGQDSLTKLNQKPELTFYRSGGGDKRDYFLWPFGGRRRGIPFTTTWGIETLPLPYIPRIRSYLSTWEAEEQLVQAAAHHRAHDPAFLLTRCNDFGSVSFSNNQPYLSSLPQTPSQFLQHSSLQTMSHQCPTLKPMNSSLSLPRHYSANENDHSIYSTSLNHIETKQRHLQNNVSQHLTSSSPFIYTSNPVQHTICNKNDSLTKHHYTPGLSSNVSQVSMLTSSFSNHPGETITLPLSFTEHKEQRFTQPSSIYHPNHTQDINPLNENVVSSTLSSSHGFKSHLSQIPVSSSFNHSINEATQNEHVPISNEHQRDQLYLDHRLSNNQLNDVYTYQVNVAGHPEDKHLHNGIHHKHIALSSPINSNTLTHQIYKHQQSNSAESYALPYNQMIMENPSKYSSKNLSHPSLSSQQHYTQHNPQSEVLFHTPISTAESIISKHHTIKNDPCSSGSLLCIDQGIGTTSTQSTRTPALSQSMEHHDTIELFDQVSTPLYT